MEHLWKGTDRRKQK